MIETLVAMYEKGAITADHFVVQCLHMIDPKDPGAVLASVPPDILTSAVSLATTDLTACGRITGWSPLWTKSRLRRNGLRRKSSNSLCPVN